MARVKRTAPKQRQLKTTDVLAEAARIASEARGVSIDIDWAQNPSNERERDLRLAIIRRVVAEAPSFERTHEAWERVQETLSESLSIDYKRKIDEARVARLKSSDARTIVNRLEKLLNDPYAEFVGADLYDAIEHWRTISEEHGRRAEELGRKRLITEALRDLPGAAQGDSGS